LAFLEHVHERHPGEGLLGGVDGLEPQHGTGDALHAAMILVQEIMQILHLTDGDGGPVRRILALDGGFIGLTAVTCGKWAPVKLTVIASRPRLFP
jgi:hypothetical protein